MKANYGWMDVSVDVSGNGTDSSGFSGLPGDYRKGDGSTNNDIGLRGFWWTSSAYLSSYELSWGRGLFNTNDGVFREKENVRNGFSVRCIKNAE